MNGASAVSNNSVGTYSVGGGINLRNNKSLTMNESSVISDNNNIGVYLRNGGSLVMNGSSAISRHDNTGAYCHGSVKCTVTMNGNSVIGGFQQSDGNTFAGVGLYGGPHSLVMKDNAAIAWNRKTGSGGGGVYVQNSSSDTAKITMTGNAVIMNNTTTGELGGGMYIGGKTNVTLSGNAKIGGANGGNSCTGTGGGGGGIYFVYDSGSVLRIQDNAVISHNSTAGRGGGVWKGASSQVINLEIVPGSISGNFAGNTNYPNIYP
jgi:hypothetical protein